jgi:hypothetical protein
MAHEELRRELQGLEQSLRQRRPADTLWNLIRSIHALPVLHEWVTLESLPLCPLVVRTGSGASPSAEAVVQLLLAVPGRNADKNALHAPWGYVAWQWPSKRLLALIDVANTVALPEVSLGSEHLATEAFADAVEAALKTGAPIPSPPPPLPELYAAVIGPKGSRAGAPAAPVGRSSAASGPGPPSGTPKETGAVAPPRSTLRPASAPAVDPGRAAALPRLLERARQLLADTGLDSLVPEWRRLSARMGEPAFSVAVAGEFGRGKSTLVNRLLGQELLPTGDLPTTALLTRVLHAPEPALWHIRLDRKRERHPLAAESWDGLLSAEDGAEAEGVLQVNLPHPWLEQTGIQLLDTPGAGDNTGRRAAAALEAIAGCDATLVTVSATMPLSLTERALVEEHILGRQVPRVAVVLTRLDQLPESARATAISGLRHRLQEWAPGVPLWCAHGPPVLPAGAGVDVAGPEAIRAALAAWAADPAHTQLRAGQLAGQLRALVQAVGRALQTRKQLALTSDQERRQALQALEAQLRHTQIDWEDLRLELEQRERRLENWLEAAVQQAQGSLQETLAFQLERTHNAKQWWEKDFPFALRRELVKLTGSLKEALQTRLVQDCGWLEEQLRKRFSWKSLLEKSTPAVADLAAGDLGERTESVTDLRRVQVLTRLGTGALMIGSLFIIPVGGSIAASVAGGLVSELLLQRSLERQKQTLAEKLPEVLAKSCASWCFPARAGCGPATRPCSPRAAGRKPAGWRPADRLSARRRRMGPRTRPSSSSSYARSTSYWPPFRRSAREKSHERHHARIRNVQGAPAAAHRPVPADAAGPATSGHERLAGERGPTDRPRGHRHLQGDRPG